MAQRTPFGTSSWSEARVDPEVARLEADANIARRTASAPTTEDEGGQAERDSQRAQWEDFRFVSVTKGWVNVVNKSHDDPKHHTYSVHVEDGEATQCSCPHDSNRDDVKCKHRRAVEDRVLGGTLG